MANSTTDREVLVLLLIVDVDQRFRLLKSSLNSNATQNIISSLFSIDQKSTFNLLLVQSEFLYSNNHRGSISFQRILAKKISISVGAMVFIFIFSKVMIHHVWPFVVPIAFPTVMDQDHSTKMLAPVAA